MYVYCVVILALLVIIRLYQKLSLKMYIADQKMTDKVVIVTGSNTGIGLATAKDLAKRGAKVILACRDSQKATAAKDIIIKSTGNPNVIFKPLDLACFKSIREFANDILKTEPRLDILINNAGTGKLDNALTEDNLPVEAQINHFGPFLLTLMLLPLLKSSAPSRIINVSSVMHYLGTIDGLDKQAKSKLGHSRVYSNTKLANVLFTKKLSEHLKGTRVTVNCLHPGAVDTDIFRHQPRFIRFLLKFLFLTPLEGAQTSIFLAVSPDIWRVTGKYFSNCTEKTPAKKAEDDTAAEKLWELSNTIVFGDKKTA